MNVEKTLTFLKDLSANNSLDWMKGHRAEYLEAKSEFTALIQDLTRKIAAYDPSVAFLRAEDLIYRLNRDTRFDKDKSPYHTAFRAHISTAGKNLSQRGTISLSALAIPFWGVGCLQVNSHKPLKWCATT